MKKALDNAQSSGESELNSRILSISKKLASSLLRLVEAVPGGPHTPTRLAAELGVNKDLSHRVVVALRQKDPLAVAHLIPGPAPLKRFVRAGSKKGVPHDVSEAAEDAVREFEQLIRLELGDRSNLDAVISVWLPEARARFEGMAKQSLYRGARHLKGLDADVVLFTAVFHPSEQASRHDFVQIHGYYGLRRVRPGAVLKVGEPSSATNPAIPPLTLDGCPVRDQRGLFLDQFCSGPPIELEVHQKGNDVVYGLNWGEAVGLSSSRDLVMAEVRRAAPRAYREPDDERMKTGISQVVNIPARVFIGDVLLHEDVYPAWEPQVRIMETGELGAADPNDGCRDLDVFDVVERIESMGQGVDRFRAAEIPDYIEMLHHVCDKMRWNPKQFRGYRTRIEYPIFGSQLQFAFDLPIAPSGASEDSQNE